MTPVHIFLIISGLAYFFFALTPNPTTYNLSKLAERAIFSFLGGVIFLSLYLENWAVYWLLGVVYTGASVCSYLGYVLWRTRWSDEPIDEIQVSMWIWDMGISACFFLLSFG